MPERKNKGSLQRNYLGQHEQYMTGITLGMLLSTTFNYSLYMFGLSLINFMYEYHTMRFMNKNLKNLIILNAPRYSLSGLK